MRGAKIGAAIERQIDPENFAGDVALTGEWRGEMEARLVLGRPPERRRLERCTGRFRAGPFHDILPAEHDGLEFDREAGSR
jgi:hypothetical protein